MTQPQTTSPHQLEYAAGQARRKFSGSMVLTTGIPTWSLVFALVFIVPKFKQIFRDFHLALPGPAMVLVMLSDWTLGWGWLVLVCLPIACGFLFPRTTLRPRTAVPIASVCVTLLVIVFAFFLMMPMIQFMRGFSSKP